MDEYHGSRGCSIHKQTKEVFAYNEAHGTMLEEARQPNEEDLPMLTIGHSSLWEQSISDISEEPLDIELSLRPSSSVFGHQSCHQS